MTTYHMETDAVRAMASQLKQAVEALHSQTQVLNNSAQSVDWLGPNRDEFVAETDGIIRQLESQVDAGNIISTRVNVEVDEWENMAAKLGDGVPISAQPPKPSATDIARQKIQEKWNAMNFDERKKLLDDWYKNLCQKLGMSPVEFKIEDLPDPSNGDYLGVFSSSAFLFWRWNSMTVDIDNVKGNDPFEVLDTVAHETQHQYQHYLIEHPDKRPDNISEEQIKQWKENFDNYKRPEDDFEAYRSQPVEVDAREAGERAVTDYVGGGAEVI